MKYYHKVMEALTRMQNTAEPILFIKLLEKYKHRYLRDNLLLLKKRLIILEPEFIMKAIEFCLENTLYNANNLIEAGFHYQKLQEQDKKVLPTWIDGNTTHPATIKL